MMKKIKQAAAAVISAAMLLSIIPAANAAEEKNLHIPLRILNCTRRITIQMNM